MNVRRVVILLTLALVLASDFSSTNAQQSANDTSPRAPIVGRSVVSTTFGIVAASQPLAARAGVQILERGGNAIDAAIAANADDRADGADRQRHSAATSSSSTTKRRPAPSTA